MQYTVIINGRSYDLPKRTIRLAEEMDRIIKNDQARGVSIRSKFQAAYNFSKQILGEENAKEVFGSDNIDEMDMSDITIAFRSIYEAYQKPVNDYNEEQARNSLNSLPIEKIARLSEAADKVVTMATAAEDKRNL